MKRLALSLGLVLTLLAAFAASASATTIVVEGNGDTTADDDVCTLREAIGSANANNDASDDCEDGQAEPTVDVINFADTPFNGMVSTTIVTSGLPDITEDLTIDAGTIGAILKPRVGIQVNPGGSNEALDIGGTGVVLTVEGLAITGADTGIHADGGTLSASDVWLGLSLDQSVVLGNNFGIKLGSSSQVGSLSADRPNVFAGNTIGIYNFSGDNNTIIRNYFGSKPDGTLATGIENGTNIRIVDDGITPDPATGNVIGGTDTGTDPNVCDSVCNLISNANGGGIDLNGTGGAEAPATGLTTISGNYVGLAFNGVGALQNDGAGILVGGAVNATIGGESDAERNYIAGNGGVGISTGAANTNLAVTRNFLGLNVAGTAAIPGSNTDMTVVGDGATISRNRIGGRGFNHVADNSSISNNVFGVGTGGENVGNAEVPLNISGDGNTIGGIGAGNTIGNHAGTFGGGGALQIIGDDNDVLGNFIGVDQAGNAHPNAANGIVLAFQGFDSDDNQVGGLTAGEGNTISNSARDAIQIREISSDPTGNSFRGNLGRNNGTSSSDLFIELGVDGPGNGVVPPGPGPNEDVEAPTITADNDSIQGTSTLPAGTPVDVYRTFTLRGDVKDQLATVTVDGGGNWALNVSLPDGTCVGATQTTALGSTSEMAMAVVDGIGCDVVGPNTTIDSGPDGADNDPTPTFTFSADEPATFECSIDDPDVFTPCSSGLTLLGLGEGGHTFRVRGTDLLGNLGPVSSRTFTIDLTAPQTTVDGFVKKPRRRRARVLFSSDEGGSSFECKLNAKPFLPCASPKVYRRLKRGKRHKIQVRATDSAGNVDATPTLNRIRVPRKRRRG